jgi:hypothetical protein
VAYFVWDEITLHTAPGNRHRVEGWKRQPNRGKVEVYTSSRGHYAFAVYAPTRDAARALFTPQPEYFE